MLTEPSLAIPSSVFISPKNSAIKADLGRKYRSIGLPNCSIHPLFKTPILSDINIASSGS